MKKIVIALALAVVLVGCGDRKYRVENLTVATFNIQWLGDGVDDREPRSPADYDAIAEIVEQTRADLIGLQEIENAAAPDSLIVRLEGYDYKIGSSGGSQKLGILYKEGVKIRDVYEYSPIAVVEGRTRPGFVVDAEKGDFDFLAMVVHFKSTSRYDSTAEMKDLSRLYRSEQAEIASLWVDSVLAEGKENDIFIIGDFNDSPNRTKYPSLTVFANNPNLTFLTTDLKSCKYKAWDVIDHVVVTGDPAKRYKPESARIFNFYASRPKEEAKKISDHCPVLADFDISGPDED